MHIFNNKTEVFEHIKRKFSKQSKTILIRGSTAHGDVNNFSDFDIEVYGNKIDKPYYELALFESSLILISVYFYQYKEGKRINPKNNVKTLFGDYNLNLKPDFSKGEYNARQRIRRECQLVVDSLFLYLRHKCEQDLENVQKKM